MIASQLPLLDLHPVAAPTPVPKKERAPTEHASWAVGAIVPRCWGVQDRRGEWLKCFISKIEARELFDTHPEAYKLYNGMCPLDAMLPDVDSTNYPCKLVETKEYA